MEGACDAVLRDFGVQLFVLFVGSTDDLTATDFAAETARLNSLGGDDALLLVAIDDRTDAIWVSDALPISDAELDSIIVDTLESSLRDGDFAGAAIATAYALGRAAQPSSPIATDGPATPPGGGPTAGGLDLEVLIGIALLGLGIVVVLVWAMSRVAAWRETGERSRRTARLAQAANAQLIAADDRIRAAEQEAGFVEAEFGADQAEPFRAAVGAARKELRAAFALRQRLDDSDPEDPPTREAMLNEIVEHTKRADAVLDAEADRIERLRSLERDAPAILAALPGQIDPVEARLPGAERVLAGFAAYAEPAWAAVRGNVIEARKGLAGARAAVARGTVALEKDRHAAMREIVTAQQGIAGATALLDAVDALAGTLSSAARELPGELDAAARDLADARAAMDDAAGAESAKYADSVARAAADLDAARSAASASPIDPIEAARRATAARRSAAELLAAVRRDAEQAARFAAALESSITAARAEIARAADFIATRRSGVRRQARTRLMEAERLFDRAVELRETDPKSAMEDAQRADQLAGEAYSQATLDFGRWDAGRRGVPNTGADVAGAILGGIIGGILSGGGRHGGWGGSPWGSPGRGSSGGGFGGGGPSRGGWGGGHGSGGSFGGFGGRAGGGGGHARGGRW